METKIPRIDKTILNNKRNFYCFPDLKPYYRAIVIKTACFGYRDGQVDQWNRMEDLELNTQTHGHLIFD